MRRYVMFGGAALLVLIAFPDAAHACAVCFDARDENRLAFLATTAFLSLLPLGMVAGTGVWLRKRSKEVDAEMGLLEDDRAADSAAGVQGRAGSPDDQV